MKIYNYDPITGEFLIAGVADESPLEIGVFLVPAHATELEPPQAGEKQVVVFENGGWTLKADYREYEAYDIDENGFYIGKHEWQIGEAPTVTIIITQPPAVQKPKWDGTKWVDGRTQEEKLDAIRTERNRLITETDWLMLPDVPVTAENRTQWQQYRQALRDFTETCNVDNPVWPIKPQYVTV